MRAHQLRRGCSVPRHYLQTSIEQSLTGLPEFRKHGGYSAYNEGWGLYAEQLGKEIGLYRDPGSDYDRLRSELFRAARLVVDTGIHDMDWSRDQVVEYNIVISLYLVNRGY